MPPNTLMCSPQKDRCAPAKLQKSEKIYEKCMGIFMQKKNKTLK